MPPLRGRLHSALPRVVDPDCNIGLTGGGTDGDRWETTATKPEENPRLGECEVRVERMGTGGVGGRDTYDQNTLCDTIKELI